MFYTMSDVCHMLAITNRQLRYLLTISGIVPTLDKLSEANVQELRAYVPGLTDDDAIMTEIEQRLVGMRAEMGAITAQGKHI